MEHLKIFAKASKYSLIYVGIVMLCVILSILSQLVGLNSELIATIGAGALLIPTIPFDGFLISLGLMRGYTFLPTDLGLIVAHGLWMAIFYVAHLAYLFFQRYCGQK